MTDDLRELLSALSPEELAEFDDLLRAGAPWTPTPGPQTMAVASEADVLGYGGAAGGGKTELVLGLSLTQHRRIAIFRRVGTELLAINDRIAEILGTREAYNARDGVWRIVRFDGVHQQIELGAFPNAGDWERYRGRPHDLLCFDEATTMPEEPVRFLLGWLRTTTPGQRCRCVLTFNPPTSAEGRWVVPFFGPWLDPKHPNPAAPGELRWFATVGQRDLEVPDSRPFVLDGERIVYDFDPAAHGVADIIRPLSRTFIPSRVADNPHLVGTGYLRQLQGLPEPLRSQLLYGDFQAGVEDDAFQVIPTAWVDAAVARWRPLTRRPQMISLGVDVARGGKDSTVLVSRHFGEWFDHPAEVPGTATPDGQTVAGHAIARVRDGAPIHLDVIGVGSSPYDHLVASGAHVFGIDVGAKAPGSDRSGVLQFGNYRAWLWWKAREMLDPANNYGLRLPPSKRLTAELTTPRWFVRGGRIYVQPREELVAKLGRSVDCASAFLLSLIDTPNRATIEAMDRRQPLKEYDPFA